MKGTFSFKKRIRPRRALIVDEQKGIVSVWALFIHDGTRRNAPVTQPYGLGDGWTPGPGR